MRSWIKGVATTLAVAVSVGLAGCGDHETEQRKAFVAFLQTRIIDKPGLHVPQLTADERTSFGPYADQYAIITRFHQVMNESVSPKLAAAMSAGAIQSLGDLATRRGDLESAKTIIDQMAAALGDDVAQADRAHRELKQPPELKAVFDQAYDRLVTTAAVTFQSIVPVADKVFADALDLAGYLDRHKSTVTVAGPTLQVSDAATRTELNAKLQGLQASQQAVQAAQTRMQTLLYGAGG